MIETLSLSPSGDGVILDIMVQPRASRAGIAGLHDGRLRLRVTAPPVDGAANAAVIQLLSEVLDVPKSGVEIIGGQSNRRKRVRIGAIDAADVRSRLAPHISAG